MTKPTLANYT